MDDSFTMGALTSNRKRGNDYLKSPVSPPNYAHIPKKSKFSFPSMSICNPRPDHTLASSSSSISTRLAGYPVLKHPAPRSLHAPVRNPKFKSVIRASDSKEGSFHRMGNILGSKYANLKDVAFGSLRYQDKREEAKELVGKYKGKEVIEIDDDDDGEEEQEEDILVDVSDDSSIEEVDVFVRKHDGVKRLDKEFRSLDSSGVSDLSNEGEKTATDLVVLDGSNDRMELNVYKKLLESSQKRDRSLKNRQKEIEVAEGRLHGFRLLRSLTKTAKPKEVKKNLAEECFVPLTKEEEREVAEALHNKNSSRILVSHENSNIDISGQKLRCLCPGQWLNDEVINVYLELLKEREKREPQKFLKCHFFNTFFYKKLISKGAYNYQPVKRWTSQRKLGYSLLECDKIFVPIHQQIHWCLAIINKKEKKFQYLDSLRGVDAQVLDELRKYYIDEVKDKNGKQIDVSAWEVEYVEDLPEQRNGFDCGMFMIKYADFYSRDLGLCFSQENMSYFRKRTVKELLRLKAE